MTFDEVLGQVLELLQQEKRVFYRGIQRRFSLDEAYLADLKEELLFAHPEIADVDGRGLVCNDEAARVAARDTLSKIYGWFTEGFDTADLQEAKALLEALH
jgi:hypothetical protein